MQLTLQWSLPSPLTHTYKLHKQKLHNQTITSTWLPLSASQSLLTTDKKQVFVCFNPFTASCENTITLSVPGVPASCEKFPHSSQLNFRSTELIFNQFSVFLKTLNAPCVCLQYKHPRSMKRVIRSDKPVTFAPPFLVTQMWHRQPRSHIIATSAVKGLKMQCPFKQR
jgi:hypothetical protein